MKEVLKQAGHGKFTIEEIQAGERDIYLALKFNLNTSTLIDEVHLALRAPDQITNQVDCPAFYEILTFVSKALVHDAKLAGMAMQLQVRTVLQVAFNMY
jgi:hypothetical protein